MEKSNNILVLSQSERNYLYNLAARHCTTGAYKAAVPLFRFLVSQDTANELYLKGLAGALHGNAEYLSAIIIYDAAYTLFPEQNADLFFYMANCWMSLKRQEIAQKCLEAFLHQVERQADPVNKIHGKMIKRAKLILASLATGQ